MELNNTQTNLGVFGVGKKVYLVLRHSDQKRSFFADESSDGFTFHKTAAAISILDKNSKPEDTTRIRLLRLTEHKGTYYLTYLLKLYKKEQLFLAESFDFKKWKKLGPVSRINNAGLLLPIDNSDKFTLVYGGREIKISSSSDLIKWKTAKNPLIAAHSSLHSYEIGTAFAIDNKIAIVYFEKISFGSDESYLVKILFINQNQAVSQTAADIKLLWKMPEEFIHERLKPIGIVQLDNVLISYWVSKVGSIYAIPHKPLDKLRHVRSFKQFFLNRLSTNPILKPVAKKFWESRAVFNPAALYDDGKIHIIYRAIGDLDTSVMGYANSRDGVNIDYRSAKPVYVPTQAFEMPNVSSPFPISPYMSGGGGYGGCEDPRIVKLDNKVYMTYVAYNGRDPPRVAFTSISLEDFRKENWNWQKPVLISAPGVVDKNACLLPEKINGKYVMFHRVFPDIHIDYLDDLNFDGETKWLKGEYKITPRKYAWDSRKLGVGAPPIKTKDGWLTIYQGVGDQDPGRYKMGAMLLDLKDPTKVSYRNDEPILSPDVNYENEGHKAGVVYPCGAVTLKDDLIVYYGGADTVVCAAKANLDSFVTNLKQGTPLVLSKIVQIANAYS